MTYIDPNQPQNDDGFVTVPQQAPESYAPVDPSFQSPPAYAYPTQHPVKKKTSAWLIIGIIALILLCCCCVVGGVGYFMYYQGYTLDSFTQLLPFLTVI